MTLSGNKLRAVRISKKLTRTEFADLLGVEVVRVTRWELAPRLTCRLERAQQMARLLGCRIETLLPKELLDPRNRGSHNFARQK